MTAGMRFLHHGIGGFIALSGVGAPNGVAMKSATAIRFNMVKR